MQFTPRKAQQAGWNVQDVLDSWQKHLLAERDKARDNPQLYAKREERLQLAVKQTSNATHVSWETLNELPNGIPAITVSATSLHAARNRMSLRELLEQRLKTRLAQELQRVGLYKLDLEGTRAAMARAIDADLWVADLDLTVG